MAQGMHSFTEENYLKALYKLQEASPDGVATSSLAQALGVHPPSVTDMLKRMAVKKLVSYQKSKGSRLTEKGKQAAIGIVRKHRLWEVFLVEKLRFGWDEVHELAEQLEHINSDELINRLDQFLGSPKADPHGDPIPDANGVLPKTKAVALSSMVAGQEGIFTGVGDHSPAFLNYLDKTGLSLGDKIKVISIEDFDLSYLLQLKGKKLVSVSNKVATSLLISERN